MTFRIIEILGNGSAVQKVLFKTNDKFDQNDKRIHGKIAYENVVIYLFM